MWRGKSAFCKLKSLTFSHIPFLVINFLRSIVIRILIMVMDFAGDIEESM